MHQRYDLFVDDGSVIGRPFVDGIFGARLVDTVVEIQFRRGQQRVQQAMGLRSAMHLLSILQAIHHDTGEEMPAEPQRAP